MRDSPAWSSPLTLRDFRSDVASLAARLEKFREREPSHRRTPIDDEPNQPRWPDDSLIPEVHASELDVAKLRSAIATRGGLIVRGLFDEEMARYYKSVIDEVLDTVYLDPSQRPGLDDPRAAFCNAPGNLDRLMDRLSWRHCRYFHQQSGSAMAIECASVAEELLELYDRRGLRDLITEYLGEPPCVSAQKWVLRRSKLPVKAAGWHQDGAFMGPEINSINMWLSLDVCGGDTGAPGLDVVPRRLKQIAGAGDGDAAFHWSVGENAVAAADMASPVFAPGDAFFFDHFYLHRTQYKEESFSRLRYAIETWFFGVGNFSKAQVPLEW